MGGREGVVTLAEEIAAREKGMAPSVVIETYDTHGHGREQRGDD
jgi:hypothetical protein